MDAKTLMKILERCDEDGEPYSEYRVDIRKIVTQCVEQEDFIATSAPLYNRYCEAKEFSRKSNLTLDALKKALAILLVEAGEVVKEWAAEETGLVECVWCREGTTEDEPICFLYPEDEMHPTAGDSTLGGRMCLKCEASAREEWEKQQAAQAASDQDTRIAEDAPE